MEFIPVKSFDSYVGANIVMGRLEQENIVCMLKNEHSVTINPVLSNAVGGIQLCVAAVQLQRCMELLQSFDVEPNYSCPDCQSTTVREIKHRTKPIRMVEKVLVFLLGDAVLPEKSLQLCSVCGREFDGYDKQMPGITAIM